MPFDGKGYFTRVHNWEDDRKNDIEIVTDHHDEEDDNFAAGLNECLLRDGRVPLKDDFDAGNFQVKNLRDATLDGDAVNFKQLKDQVDELKKALLSNVNNSLKVGDIKTSLQTGNHDNWLLCNGQEISRADYPDLFKVIGVNFGAGNGTTTFNVPNYQGAFLRGLGGNSAENFFTKQNEGLPNIIGASADSSFCNVGEGTGCIVTEGSGRYVAGSSALGAKYSRFRIDASISSGIYGASAHVTPENYAVNYFIKAKAEV